MQTIDPSKSAEENVLELIKHSNTNLQISGGHVRVEDPEPFFEQDNYRNTQVDVVPAKPGYKGRVTVKYARLKLHQEAEEGEVAGSLELDYPGDQQAWYDEIIRELGLVGDEVRMFVNEQPYDAVTNPIRIPSTIELRPVEDSLLYLDVETLIQIALEEEPVNVDGEVRVAIQVFDIDVVEIG